MSPPWIVGGPKDLDQKDVVAAFNAALGGPADEQKPAEELADKDEAKPSVNAADE